MTIVLLIHFHKIDIPISGHTQDQELGHHQHLKPSSGPFPVSNPKGNPCLDFKQHSFANVCFLDKQNHKGCTPLCLAFVLHFVLESHTGFSLKHQSSHFHYCIIFHCILYIYFTFAGHLFFFQFLAITNNAAFCIFEQVS